MVAMSVADAKALYRDEFRPLWAQVWGAQGLPAEIVVEGNALDRTGGEDWVMIGGGVLAYTKAVAWFAIAHEMSHSVTPSAVRKLGVRFPDRTELERCRIAEHAADLIAFHTLVRHRRRYASAIHSGLDVIATLLGGADDMHPAGTARAGLLKEYYTKVCYDGRADFAELKRLALGVFR
jgi:hypothetical protein